VWKGELYKGVDTGFDAISWYATTKNGRAREVSLSVRRGQDGWVLEVNDEQGARNPPDLTPHRNLLDPNDKR